MKRFAFFLLGGLLLSAPAYATTIDVFSTGVDAAGLVVDDQIVGDLHYNLTSVPSGETSETKIITSASGYPIGPYVLDDSLSRWIGPNHNNLASMAGDYVYETTFDLTGLDFANAILEGFWSTDNAGSDILLNGISTGNSTTGGAYVALHAFSILSGFKDGVNKLEFLVHNNSSGPTALRVQISGSIVPIPPALPLFGTGVALLGFLGWRRKRKAA